MINRSENNKNSGSEKAPLKFTQDGEKKGVYLSTYGCQMNVNDSERMLTLLEMQNYVEVKDPEAASLILINSCSVREKPVHKILSEAGKYRKLKEKNPDLKIGVGGCVGQQEKGVLLKRAPTLDFVFGPDNIDSLPELVQKVNQTNEKVTEARFHSQQPYHIETLVRNPTVSTFVNIMKGCDNFCTFCVVPFTRGRERSRPLKDVIQDIKTLVAKGTKEITLLGQNVNSYKSECGAKFSDLLKAVAEDTDILRIRYTSPHPKDFNEEVIELHQKYRAKICDQLHMPAQSGSTEVLKRMNRTYTREEFMDKVKMIREKVPGMVFSTDLIVGFPGETEEQFLDTCSLVEEVGFENIYAFAYSPRPFTKAARFEDQLDEETKNRRLQQLILMHKELAFVYAKKYENNVYDVLVEKQDEYNSKLFVGRTTHNKLVHFEGASVDSIGKIVPVKITTAFPVNLKGIVQA